MALEARAILKQFVYDTAFTNTHIYIYLDIILDWHGQSRYVCTYIFAMNTENNEEFVNIDTSLYLEWSNPILLIVKTNSWRTNISTVNAISNI